MDPSPVLLISLSSPDLIHGQKAASLLGQCCYARGIPLVCLFSECSGAPHLLSLLNRPEDFLKAVCGEARDLSRDVIALGKSIDVLEPDFIAVCPDSLKEAPWEDEAATAIISFLGRHRPGAGILALDPGGGGQWVTDHRPAGPGFRALADLLPEMPGRSLDPNRTLNSKCPGAWQAAGPVLPVWPGACGSPEKLARVLSSLGQPPPSAGSGCFLFMAGPGEEALDPESLAGLLTPWLEEKSKEVSFGIQIPICQGFDPISTASAIDRLREAGLKLIHWIWDGVPGLHRQLLWQVSRWGIWNHITGRDLFRDKDPAGPGAWIANNPNIVHSFGSIEPGPGPSSERVIRTAAPRELQSYGALPTLPGLPFRQLLGNSRNLLAALCHAEAKALVRLRADTTQRKVLSLGSTLEFSFKKPGDIDKKTMDEIVAMVDAGGSVDITHVRANLQKAYLIAYATENGVIVGNSSLKHPRQIFIDRLHRSTGLDFTNCVERGYTSVRPEYRAMGIGAKLLEGLTARASDVKVFSLISEDNLATQKIAIRNNTRKIAVYFSDKVGKDMGVWMPEHMIDESGEIDL